MLFGSLPVIEFVELKGYFAMYMAADGVPKRLPTTPSHLKILKLNDICFGELEGVSIILCLIRSSPNLAKIEIGLLHFDETAASVDPVLELLQMQDWSDVSLNQLRVVEMKNISGKRSELEFIKHLLAKSLTLETMLIKPDSEVVLDNGLRILKEVTRFRHLSPQAEITYH